MPVEAALTMLGGVVFVAVFLLSEGSFKAVTILVFVCGILFSTSGLANTVRDLITQIATR